MNTNKQRVLIVTLLFLIVGSCAAYATIDLPVRSQAQTDHMYWESVHRGALLYANNCRTCHGNQGEGFIAPALNTPEWRDQDPIVLAENQDILQHTLNCGRAGTTMPAWLDENGGSLNVRQIGHLVNFMTAPEEGEEYLDEFGEPTNRGWAEALEFAHNLNMDLAATIGGDTLSSIATQHNIGVELLANENNVSLDDVDEIIPRGDTIRVPASSAYPDGFQYQIRSDFDSILSLAGNLYVGAAAIADLNGLPFAVNYSERTFTLLDNDGNPLPGLMPGETLELPPGATYTVFAGDTLTSIAEQHSISVQELRALNEALLDEFGDTDELDGNRRLDLPDDPTVIVGEGEGWEAIASRYDLTAEELALLNGGDAEDPDQAPVAGDVLQLPPGSRYIVQEGVTFEDIAAAHGTDVATLQDLNNVDDPASVTHEVILELPAIDTYVVVGHDFDEAAEDFGQTSGAALAEANGLSPDDAVRIGTQLELPPSSTGTAPPDALNLGIDCIQNAIPHALYEELFGEGEAFDPDAPEEFTAELIVRSYEIDWTFEADGEEQTPNRGVAKVTPGTTVTFENPGTLTHTVTIDGTDESGQFAPGDTFQFTFDEPGRFRLECDNHPSQHDGYVFVEEE